MLKSLLMLPVLGLLAGPIDAGVILSFSNPTQTLFPGTTDFFDGTFTNTGSLTVTYTGNVFPQALSLPSGTNLLQLSIPAIASGGTYTGHIFEITVSGNAAPGVATDLFGNPNVAFEASRAGIPSKKAAPTGAALRVRKPVPRCGSCQAHSIRIRL